MNKINRHCLKLILQYDGTAFHGWQIQPSERTVQGEIESTLLGLTGEPCPVVGSGRTDKGVHATGQVASVSLPTHWTADKLHSALNSLLPSDIRLKSSSLVNPAFHARYDAISRTYLYNIGLTEESYSPFNYKWCWPFRSKLNQLLLNKATELITGEHSFKSFAKSGQEERGYTCTIHEASWNTWEDLGLSLRITGNRFLHHMVRYLVGTMTDVAIGKRPLLDIETLLENPEHALVTSPPAPPTGLFLTQVAYPNCNEVY